MLKAGEKAANCTLPASVTSHQNFINKHDLNFTLLSDPEHKVAEAYGAWGEKSMYGKKY